jgi:polysaccharide biosynthesis transport protein
MTRAATPTAARPAQAPQRARPAGPTIDPVRILRQNIIRILVWTVGGAILGVILNYVFLYTYPLWSSQVLLEIKSQLEAANDLNTKDIITEDTVVRLAQTEVARLTQKDNLTLAMQRPEILKTTWSEGFRDKNGTFIVEDAVLTLDDELKSGHRRGTQIFYIAWNTHVPEDAPIVLNAIADTYINVRRRADDARFNNTLKVYEEKREQLDRAILQKKGQIQDFIKANGLTSLSEANSENQRTLEKLRNDIAQTTADLNVAQSRRTQIEQKQRNEAGFSDDDKRRAQEDPIVLQLQRDMEDFSRRFKSAKQQFGETHPSYIALKAEYEETQRAVDRKMAEVLARNLAADYKDAFNKEESFAKLLKQQTEDFEKATKKVEGFTANMAEMRTFEDQVAVLQEQRREVGKTIQDINLALAREERNRVEIVQRALKPREITFPQFKYMIPLTAVVVAGLYVLILFIRELLDQRIKYPSDLMAVPGRILGTVPELSDDPSNPKRAELVVRESPQSVLAENYRQLSAQVMKGMLANGAKSLMVISAMPEAGTTTVALNLAACEAAVGRRVLIIGANMRRPGLSRALGISLGLPGLGEILSGADPASVVTVVTPNIDMIPAGAPEHRVFERLSGDRLDEVLRWARDHYDLVIVDGPPSVVAGEALTIANKVDASMIVARAWQDQRGLVMKLAGQLLESRSQFLGVMLNRMHMTAGGYLRKNAEAMAEYAERTAAFGGSDTLPEQTRRKAKPKAT